MSDSKPQDGIEAVSIMFYQWLTDRSDDIYLSLIDLTVYVDEQNLIEVFDVLDIIQSRIQHMRTVSILFDGYIDKHKQLVKSIQPKEDEYGR